MRRLAAGLLAAAAAAALLAAAPGGDAGDRVDAIFDNSASLIPGQDVKIAGARVGSVRDVTLTGDRRARVEMEVGEGFAPFRADARCSIRPQSLIGEKFVQCDPGTPSAPPLPADDSGRPTVPVERTSSPVDLDLVFAALRRPTDERLAIVVSELGSGLAGRPRELSETIRRANPALREARDVLRILDRDREVLGRLVDRSDAVLERLASADRRVASFIERADEVGAEVAARRDGLEESVRRLDPLLAELEPAARDLAALTRDATPLVRQLRVAAPPLRDLAADIGPLADAARPTIAELGRSARAGRSAVRALEPLVRRVPPIVDELVPVVPQLRDLAVSARESGVSESLLRFLHYTALAESRFDAISHITPSYQIGGACNNHATTPVPGCEAHIGERDGETEGARRRTRSRRPARRRREAARPRPAPVSPQDPPPAPRRRSRLPELPPEIRDRVPVIPLLDYLLAP